jgi:VWFA-related protein
MKDQADVRQQMLAYLKSVPPGTRIAIFGLTSRLLVLQSFTSDPEVLKAVMTQGIAKASPLLDDAVGGGGVQNSQADDMEDNGGDPSTVANLRQFEAQTETFQLQLRAQFTLDALNDLARYLAGIPGRKNLIWFSGSFPVNILPDITGTLPDPFAAMASSEDEFRETVTLLARSQVAVYPIDARGLFNSPVFDASTNRNYGGATGNARMRQDQTKFFTNTNEEHNTMQAMADATGGRAFVDTNGLTKAVATAIDEGSNFYTLTYTPPDYAPDGKFRKIKVEVDHQGINLAYRRGYYADPPGLAPGGSHSTIPDAAVANAGGTTSQQTLHAAMMRGAPLPTEILLKVAVSPSGPATQTEDKVAPGNMPDEKTKGPFRRYDVGYAISPSDILFRKTSDGKVHADFDLIVFVFNPNGALVNSLSAPVRIAANLDDVKKAAAHGLLYNLQVSAPARGEYFFRIAVRDLQRERYGAVEVATSQVRNLPPATVPTAAPATPAK